MSKHPTRASRPLAQQPTSSPEALEAEAKPEALSAQMQRLQSEGYAVLPSSFAEGSHDLLADLPPILNFTSHHHDMYGRPISGGHRPSSDPLRTAGGFTSSGMVIPTPDAIGTPGRGYIAWGSNNNLPNCVALANNTLVYTAVAQKFNIDTLCGLGIEPIYTFHQTVGCNENEEYISYEHAGSYIDGRIQKLQTQLFNLLKDHQAAPAVNASNAVFGNPSPAVSGEAIPIQTPPAKSPITPDDPDTAPEDTPTTDPGALPIADLHHPDGQGYKRYADTILDDIITNVRAQITQLRREKKVWGKTWAQLKRVMAASNPVRLAHDLSTDMATYNICFPEILLSQDTTRQSDSASWKPRIAAIRYRDALTCRLEEKDPEGVSRYVYISNQWLDTAEATRQQQHATAPSQPQNLTPSQPQNLTIAALPALDPTCASLDLDQRIRQFRTAAAAARDRVANTEPGTSEHDEAQAQLALFDAASRPTRFILPVDYRTTGRYYYPQPAYWTIYRDIYQFASNIIRDRAIRKQNEAMFTYVLYVHQGYLDKLTQQLNAQKTEEEKKAFRHAEVQKIKDFLSNKQNNGSTLAATTFIGPDGKDHDAFRVERIDYNTKSNAEADKTEITDISSIIMFAFECHPDLIGSTPGGASSSGGTYQREMLLIKQAQMVPMQQLMLYPWYVAKDFSKWDTHLDFKIKQKVLTTLDASKTGTTEE